MKSRFIFPLFWLITCLVYRNIFGDQFLDDTLSGIVSFNEQGWAGFGNSFGFTSIYFAHDLIYFGFYELFGLNNWAWFLLFTGVHALNACLGYSFLSKVLARRQIQLHSQIAFSAALFFLLSPYQTENVVWGATMHYLFSMLFLWSGFFLYEKYLLNNRVFYFISFLLLFAVSLCTLEISLMFPGLYAVVFIFLWEEKINRQKIFKHLKLIIAPMAVIIIGYFILNKVIHGMYIGHYQSKTHLASFFTLTTVTTIEQYFAKCFGYIHFFSYNIRYEIYQKFTNGYVCVGVVASLILILLLIRNKFKKQVAIITIFLLLSVICLIPVCSMYFMYLNQVNNDRLSYFALFFMYLLLAYLLSIAGRKILIAGTLLITCLNLFLLNGFISRWDHASKIQQLAYETFQWENADHVYILNQPNYYNGVYIFRNPERLERTLKIFREIDMHDRITEIAWVNMFSPDDQITISKQLNDTIEVSLNEWGRWFWYDNKGALDYSNEVATVDFDDWNHSYKLHFNKQPGNNDVIIYFTPKGWKEL